MTGPSAASDADDGPAPTGAWAGRIGQSVLDQGLSSGTQLLLLVLLARASSVAEFGAASSVLLVHGLVLGLQRAAVGDVALLRLRRPGADPDEVARAGLAASLGVALLEVVVLGCIALLATDDTRVLLLVTAAVAPAVCVQDLLRSVAYGRGRIGDATVIDATWLACQVAGAAALLVVGSDSPATMMAAWGLGAVVSAVVGLARTGHRPGWRALLAARVEDAARSRAFVVDYMSESGASTLATLGLGQVIGAASFGALRVAMTSVMPPSNLMGSTRALVLGRIGSHESQPRLACRTALVAGSAFGTMTLVYGAVLVLLPVEVGAAVFGDAWRDAATIVGAVAAAEALRFASLPAVDVVRALGRPSTLVRTRLAVTGTTIAVTLVGGVVAGLGVVWFILGARVLGAGVWWWQAAEVTRTRHSASAERLERALVEAMEDNRV